jgi:hypothetical protein
LVLIKFLSIIKINSLSTIRQLVPLFYPFWRAALTSLMASSTPTFASRPLNMAIWYRKSKLYYYFDIYLFFDYSAIRSFQLSLSISSLVWQCPQLHWVLPNVPLTELNEFPYAQTDIGSNYVKKLYYLGKKATNIAHASFFYGSKRYIGNWHIIHSPFPISQFTHPFLPLNS